MKLKIFLLKKNNTRTRSLNVSEISENEIFTNKRKDDFCNDDFEPRTIYFLNSYCICRFVYFRKLGMLFVQETDTVDTVDQTHNMVMDVVIVEDCMAIVVTLNQRVVDVFHLQPK